MANYYDGKGQGLGSRASIVVFVGGFISTRNADGRRTGAMERFQTVVRKKGRYVFVLSR